MNVSCPKCGAAYEVDVARVPVGGVDMKCSRCLHTFKVNPHAGGLQGPTTAELNLKGVTFLGQSAEQGSGFPGGDAEKFFIQRQSGKVFGPFEKRLILQMLKAGKLTGEEGVSRDKSFWVPMATVPDFRDAVEGGGGDARGMTQMGTPASALHELPGLGRPSSAELPTPMGGGMWGSSSGVAELPGLRGGEPELPGLRGGGPELPAPMGYRGFDAELPTPRGGGPELPTPRGGGMWGSSSEVAELPGLRASEPELPGLRGGGGPELPGMRGGAELPGMRGGGGPELPMNRPSGKTAELPVRVEIKQAELPVSGQGRPNAKSELPMSRGGVELPKPIGHFEGGSVVREKGGAPLPVSKKLADVGNDLFDEDLETNAFKSFQSPQQVDQFGVSDSRVMDLGGAPLSNPRSFASQDEEDDAPSSFDPSRPMGEDSSDEETTREYTPSAESDEQRPSASDKGSKGKAGGKRQNVVLLAAIGVVAVLLVAVVALILWQTGMLPFGEPAPVVEGEKPVEVVQPKVKGSLWSRALPDTFQAYNAFQGDIQRELGNAPTSPVLKGQSVVGRALYLAHYPEDQASFKEAERLAGELKDAKEPEAALGRGAFKVLQGDVAGARKELEPLTEGEGEVAYHAHLLLGLQSLTLPSAPASKKAGEAPADAPKDAPADAPKDAPADAPKDAPAPEKGAEAPKGEGVMDFMGEVSPDAGAAPDGGAVAQNPAPQDEAQPESDLAKSSREHLQAAAKLNPKAPAPRFFLGLMEARSQKFAKAKVHYEEALKLNAEHVPAILELARLAYLSGDPSGVKDRLDPLLPKLEALGSKRERSQAHLYLGLALSSRRKSQDAIAAMVESLKVDPSNAEALKALGEEFFRNRKFDEALNYFTTNTSLSQKDPEVMLGIVKSYTGLDKLPEASKRLEVGSQAFPTDPRFPFYLALIREKEGNWTEAQKQYRSAIQIDPGYSKAHVKLALLLLKDNKKDEALKLLAEAERLGAGDDPAIAVDIGQAYLLMGDEKRALGALEKALKLNASNLDARIRLSRYYLDTERIQKALEILGSFSEGEIDDPELNQLLADIYRRQGQYEKSIEKMDKLIEQDPKNPRYMFGRGMAYFDWQNYDTAKEQFFKAYSLDPKYTEAYFYVGRVEFERKDYVQAIKVFRAVLDEKQDNGEYRYWMGFALERSGNLTQALEEYQSVERFDGVFAQQHPDLFYRRGRILTLQGNYRQAKEDLGRVLERDNKHFGALVALGDTFFDERKYTQAAELYERALTTGDKAEQQVGYVHYKLGLSYGFLKRNNDALEALERAVSNGYEEPRAYKMLGFGYRDSGQGGRAVKSFRRYLELKPDAGDRKEILSEIERLGG